MPADFDRCVAKVKKQQKSKGKSDKEAEKSAFAICTAQFKKFGKTTQKMKNLKLQFNTPITESATLNDEFVIRGTAISETTTSNGHTFLAEELKPAAEGMIGIPLLKDHRNEVDAIMGRVIGANFDEELRSIPFKARVNDKEARKLIERGDLNSVSIGATVRDLEEDEKGNLIARGITIKELSLVAVPADESATFGVALMEAYQNKSKSFDKIELKGGKEQMTEKSEENKEAEEMKTKLEMLEKQVAEYKAKERKALESSYKKMCEEKGVECLDISEQKDSSIELLMKQMETIKCADTDEAESEEEKPEEKEESEEQKEEPKAEPEEKEEEAEEESQVADEKFKFVESHGSLSGQALTIVR